LIGNPTNVIVGQTIVRIVGYSVRRSFSWCEQSIEHQSLMNILDLVVGKPIRTSDERAEQIGPVQGIPIFGLDALSSAAYGPEAALSLLIPLGLLGVRYIVPISAAIITLLVIVYFSYRQTIAAYPSGGGSYTVARFNLGAPASLLAAAALLADYILTAAVGISAGVGALISAVPSLLPHTVSLCVGILIVITILNLRGVREAGTAFAVPTYLFVGTLLITIVAGILRVFLSGGHPTPAVPLPPSPPMTAAVSYWLLLKVFASGCTALTGVEAVSNGVKAFREPTVKNAQRTLTVIIFLLAVLLAGISYLVKVYGIAATDPGQPGYQSVLSILTAAVFGKGLFYYLTIGSILVVLSLSANTAFADFPRLCRAIAQNNYLPHIFGYRGRGLSTPMASSSWQSSVAACLFFSAASLTGLSRCMPLALFWPLHSPKQAWSCTGGKIAVRIS
jgi:amino acid transporter